MNEDTALGWGCLMFAAAVALAIASPVIVEIIKTVQGR